MSASDSVGAGQVCVCQCVVVFHFFGDQFPFPIRGIHGKLIEYGCSSDHAQPLLGCHRIVTVPAKFHFISADGVFGRLLLVRQSAELVRGKQSDILHCHLQEVADTFRFETVRGEYSIFPVSEDLESQCSVSSLPDIVDLSVQKCDNLSLGLVQCDLNRRGASFKSHVNAVVCQCLLFFSYHSVDHILHFILLLQ